MVLGRLASAAGERLTAVTELSAGGTACSVGQAGLRCWGQADCSHQTLCRWHCRVGQAGLSTITGLDYWTGLLDWTTGLDYWTTNLTTKFQLRSKKFF